MGIRTFGFLSLGTEKWQLPVSGVPGLCVLSRKVRLSPSIPFPGGGNYFLFC